MLSNAIAFVSIIVLVISGFVYEKSIKNEIRYLVGVMIVINGFVYQAIISKVIKEREAARKPIEDTENKDSLRAEVHSFKTLLLSEWKTAEEAKQEFAISQAKYELLMKKFEEAERKAKELQDSVHRFEEKLSNVESENRVLRQQALAIPSTGKSLATQQNTTVFQTTPEDENVLQGEPQNPPDMSLVVSNPQEPETEKKPHKSLNENQQENQNFLIKYISQDLGFSGGKPIAACVIYKSLLHWRSLEVEGTTVFDHIIQTICSAIEVQDINATLSYWLSNSSTLLLLLQHALSMTSQRQRALPASLFDRMSQELGASQQSAELSFLNGRLLGGMDDLRQVEVKYPALLFKKQLAAVVEKIYGMIRENLKEEITPLLGLCIQAPRTSRASLVKGNAVAQAVLIGHWQSIVKKLDDYLQTLKANFVPPYLVRSVFTQIFWFINVHLFNSLLLRRECCCFSNGEYVKSGLTELEQWCVETTEEYTGLAWEELKHIRHAVGFLVIHQKPEKTLNEITKELCPVLSIQQLYRISTMYWDDKYGTHGVSSDVISSMRVLMTKDSNNGISSSFLLDDDSSIPFSVDDIYKSMEQIDIADVDPPPLIRENSGLTGTPLPRWVGPTEKNEALPPPATAAVSATIAKQPPPHHPRRRRRQTTTTGTTDTNTTTTTSTVTSPPIPTPLVSNSG